MTVTGYIQREHSMDNVIPIIKARSKNALPVYQLGQNVGVNRHIRWRLYISSLKQLRMIAHLRTECHIQIYSWGEAGADRADSGLGIRRSGLIPSLNSDRDGEWKRSALRILVFMGGGHKPGMGGGIPR